ncbi:hypothetical protein SAMN05421847_2192 [Halpernia humi]|uniref:Uncharacterized protein n=1 Tax=Halpernia humi TaxID=493375 RepID=A0A1H5ZVR1_9FLAO|nr:hypothetical protein [Halpernia humi]SEG39536.1 hypothetical protein SAMN05421847_2192 [Halpernia humi]
MSLATKKAAAKTALVTILEEMMTREETSIEEFSERIIDVLEVWLKEASIQYISGLIAPNGAVTGTFEGKLE